MKLYLLLFISCLSFSVMAQSKIDLSKVVLNEPITPLISSIKDLHKGLLFDQQDMISYGIDGNKVFSFNNYQPPHLEMLSYQNKLAGFAFRITTLKNQSEIRFFLLNKYTLKMIDNSPIATIFKHVDEKCLIELTTITAEQFKGGRFGYLSIKSVAFVKQYDLLDKKYSRSKNH